MNGPFQLTPRETEAITLAIAGNKHGQIAKAMGISTQSAKNYLKKIYVKMGVHSRIAMVTAWAEAHGRDTPYLAVMREENIRLTEEVASLQAQLFALGIDRDNWKNRACRATKYAVSSR